MDQLKNVIGILYVDPEGVFSLRLLLNDYAFIGQVMGVFENKAWSNLRIEPGSHYKTKNVIDALDHIELPLETRVTMPLEAFGFYDVLNEDGRGNICFPDVEFLRTSKESLKTLYTF